MSNLMKYLPPYYEEVKEINAIMAAENPEIDGLWAAVFKVKCNQFILDADDITIRKWEKLLRILPDYRTQDLGYRKSVVLMRLASVSPITHRWLIEKLDNTFGQNNSQIEFDYDSYEILISVYDKKNIFEEFQRYLRNIIPANLTLLTRKFLPHRPTYETNIYINVHIASRRHFTTNPVRR